MILLGFLLFVIFFIWLAVALDLSDKTITVIGSIIAFVIFMSIMKGFAS